LQAALRQSKHQNVFLLHAALYVPFQARQNELFLGGGVRLLNGFMSVAW
jgi:hypothetical protein